MAGEDAGREPTGECQQDLCFLRWVECAVDLTYLLRGPDLAGDEGEEFGEPLPEGVGEFGVAQSSAAVATLLILAPVVAEVLSGSTPITGVFGLLFFIPMYGAGALLIREVTRRRRAGWASVLLLGAAFALVEEGLVVQAIFHPQAVEAASWGAAAGAHLAGVYGIFTLAVVTYHAVWSIALPIVLCDLLFPAHRNSPLLDRAGLAVVTPAFAAGLVLVAALVRTRIAPGYSTPPGHLAVTAVAIVALIALAYLPRLRTPTGGDTRPNAPPSPWTVAVLVAAAGFAFLGLLMFPAATDTRPAWANPAVSASAAVVIAAAVLWLLHRWSHASGWNDPHRLAIAAGLLLVSPAVALIQATLHSYGNPGDRIGLVATEIATAGFVVWLSHRLRPTKRRQIVGAGRADPSHPDDPPDRRRTPRNDHRRAMGRPDSDR